MSEIVHGRNFLDALRIDDLEKKNAELMAQVEQLRQSGAELLNECEGLGHSNDIWLARGLTFGNVQYQDAAEKLAVCINKTPAQCLAEVRAQAGWIAYIHCLDRYGGSIHPDYHSQIADEYANQLRQQAKAGE